MPRLAFATLWRSVAIPEALKKCKKLHSINFNRNQIYLLREETITGLGDNIDEESRMTLKPLHDQ